MKCNVFRVHPCVAPPFFFFFLVTAASYFNVQRYHNLFKHFLIRCVSLLFQALLQWVTLNTCHFLLVLVHMFHPFPELSFLEKVVNTIVILLHVATHSIALPPAMCELPTSTFLLSLPAEHIARLWMFANLVGLKKKASKSVWFSCAFLVDIGWHWYPYILTTLVISLLEVHFLGFVTVEVRVHQLHYLVFCKCLIFTSFASDNRDFGTTENFAHVICIFSMEGVVKERQPFDSQRTLVLENTNSQELLVLEV